MSNDQPASGQPPEDDDPFRKRPQEPPSPPAGSPFGGATPPPPPPPPPYGPGSYGGGPYGGVDPLAGMPPLAEPGRRIVARLVDFLIISIPLYLISLIFGGAIDMSSDNNDNSVSGAFNQTYNGHQLIWSLIGLAIYVAYDTYLTHKDGRTIGKRLMKLRVAMLSDGRVPETRTSFVRAVVLWLPALLCCPCLWWLINIVLMFTDKPYRQGLQDKAAKTVVVQAR
ncbi:RDD family protein [Streptomyces sp. DT24]|uniref:RDD family protein n=1 Tax=unclassified Streptomyces TaxID=2593676 RepID=UPI0023B9BCF9|nr:RDD family protein [Streptomyces sp. AM 4-1-1]WEH33665.1 RDD family protein [Streptomyces sp. AM 4-1-1]